MADIQTIARETVALNLAGRGKEAGERHWADDVVSIEPMDGPMARVEGKSAVKAKSDWWYANHEMHALTADGPYVSGDQFIVHYGMDVTQKENGQRFQMKEAALYTVRDGKIVEERFFFGGDDQ